MEFVNLLQEIPKANSEEQIAEGYKMIGEFVKKLNHKKRDDQALKNACGKMIEYLIDTKEHMEKGYHKPAHNGWNIVRVYPDINDYVNIGIRLKTF